MIHAKSPWRTAARLLLWIGLAALCPAAESGSGGGPDFATHQPLRLLTWNVLAPTLGERLRGLVGRTPQERAGALLDEARALDADILAFQEVSAPFMAALAADPVWSTYHLSAPGADGPPGGLLVLTRHRIAKAVYRKLPSPSGRYALFVTLDLNGQPLVVIDVHLESLPQDRYARRAQLDFIAARLPHTTPWIWAGDFNFGDQDPESADIVHRVDVWTRLRPADPGHTYDLSANPLAKANAFTDEPSRRLDRILSSSRLSLAAVRLAGQAFGADGPVSDHFGVWADLVPSP